MKFSYPEDGKPIPISEVVGADPLSFHRYMVAKTAVIRMGTEKGPVTLSREEVNAIFEFCDDVSHFYRLAMS